MEAQNQEVAALVDKITGLHAAISKLPSLTPSPEVDALFTELVATCVPSSPVDVTKLGPEAQAMREDLIRLCSAAEGHLEAHYSDVLTAFDSPLDHLDRFPYYDNYVNLSKLEHGFLARHVAAPARVAFIGSGPLPFSSLFLATYHLRDTRFDNYDRCGAANDRARRLVGASGGSPTTTSPRSPSMEEECNQEEAECDEADGASKDVDNGRQRCRQSVSAPQRRRGDVRRHAMGHDPEERRIGNLGIATDWGILPQDHFSESPSHSHSHSRGP